MKKALSCVVAFAAFCLALISCGGSTLPQTASEDSLKIDTVATLDPVHSTFEALLASFEETVGGSDAKAIDDALVKCRTELQRLVDAGDVEQARDCAARLKAVLETNSDALKSMSVNTEPATALITSLMGEAEEHTHEMQAEQDGNLPVQTSAAVGDSEKKSVDGSAEKGQEKVIEHPAD